VAGVLFLLFFASAAASPRYRVYQAEWRFSATTLTVIFGVYALTLLATLLVFGSLLDYLGRRRVIAVALAAGAGACGLFLAAHGAGLLFAARALSGAAAGIATSAGGAALIDLQPEGSGRAPVVSSAAVLLGLGAGGLGTSALVQYAPAPIHLIWWLLLGACAVAAVAVLAIPETTPGRRVCWPSPASGLDWSLPSGSSGTWRSASPSWPPGWPPRTSACTRPPWSTAPLSPCSPRRPPAASCTAGDPGPAGRPSGTSRAGRLTRKDEADDRDDHGAGGRSPHREAQRDVAVPGRGAHLRCSYGAIGAFRDIAEALGCAVAVMPDAKGLFPEDHPQYTGIYGGSVRGGRRDSRHGPAGGGRR
jgi:hypothetical protein